MQEIEPKSNEEKEIRADFGDKLLDRYMAILADPSVFVDEAECHSSEHFIVDRSVSQQPKHDQPNPNLYNLEI